MIVKEYLKEKICKFGIFTISEADLLDICEKSGLDSEKEVNNYSVIEREKALVSYVPELLLFIDTIDENGFRVSRSDTVNKVKLYYSLKCRELNLTNALSDKPVISDASNLW